MKKIILISIIILQSCFGFSQEEPKEKISQVDFFAVNTFFGLRLRQTVFNQDLQFQARIREGKNSDLYVGKMISFNKSTFAVVSVGMRYSLEYESIDELLRVEIRSRQSWGMIRVNYGLTNFNDNGVSTSIVYNIMGHFIRAGLSSNNEYFGPRIEFFLPLGKDRVQRSLRAQVSLLSNGNVVFGVRVRFGGRYKI